MNSVFVALLCIFAISVCGKYRFSLEVLARQAKILVHLD